MNEDKKKLYDILIRDGYIKKKDFSQFQIDLEKEEYQDKVFNLITEKRLFTKDKESFLSKYAVSPQQVETTNEPITESEKPLTNFSKADNSWFEKRKKKLTEDYKQIFYQDDRYKRLLNGIENKTKPLEDYWVNNAQNETVFDLTTDEGVDNANVEFNNIIGDIQNRYIREDSSFLSLVNEYSNNIQEQLKKDFTNYKKAEAEVKKAGDIVGTFGTPNAIPFFSGEGFLPSLYNSIKYRIPQALKGTSLMTNSKRISALITEKNSLLQKDPNESYFMFKKPEDKGFLIDSNLSQFSNVSASNVTTVANRLESINKLIPQLQAESLKTVLETNKVNDFLSNLSDNPKILDGLSFTEFGQLAGQQLPNMGAAILAPFVGSYVLEGGNLYLENLQNIAEQEFGEDYTLEQMSSLIGSGKDGADQIQNAAGLSASLDFVGAANLIKVGSPFIKKYGKEVLKEIQENGYKKLPSKQALSKLGNSIVKQFTIGAGSEGITEGGQSLISQYTLDRLTTKDLEFDTEGFLEEIAAGALFGGKTRVITSSLSDGELNINYTKESLVPTTKKKRTYFINNKEIKRRNTIKSRINKAKSESDLAGIIINNDKEVQKIYDEKLKSFQGDIKSVKAPNYTSKLKDVFEDKTDQTFKDKIVDSFNNRWTQFLQFFTDRQIVPRTAFKDANMNQSKALMTNYAGINAYAGLQISRANDKIYKNIDKSARQTLDDIIVYRRIIDIDSQRDAKKQDRPKHPEGFNKETAEKELQNIKNQLGEKGYNALIGKSDLYATEYQRILQEKLNEGMITEETFNNLKDSFYSPRMFLKHFLKDENYQSYSDFINIKESEFNNLKDGSDTALLKDSQFLLSLYQLNHENRKFINKFNKTIFNEAQGKNLNWFKEITETENVPDGFTKISFKENGELKSFALKDDLAKNLYVAQKSETGATKYIKGSKLELVSGASILRAQATGLNPTFAAVNTTMDGYNIIFNTDLYNDVPLPIAMAKLTHRASVMAQNLISKKVGIKDLQSEYFLNLYEDFVKHGGMMKQYALTTDKTEIKTGDKVKSVASKIGGAFQNVLATPGEISEMMMRLASFERARKVISEKNSNLTQEEINNLAVEKSRSALDFAQGGTVVKDIDRVIPYLNVTVQGMRVAINNLKNNTKGAVSTLSQGALASATLGFAIKYALGDDEEDIKDFNNIPEYVKRTNDIFLIPKTSENAYKLLTDSNGKPILDEEGNQVKIRRYVAIRRAPNNTEFLYNANVMGQRLYDLVVKNEDISKLDSPTAASFLSGLSPFATEEFDLVSILIPPAKEVYNLYKTNYDKFRNDAVSKEKGKVYPFEEGQNSLFVPYFLKAMTEPDEDATEEEKMDTYSPKRLQKSLEKLVTQPTTNIVVGAGYKLFDNIAIALTNPDEFKKSIYSNEPFFKNFIDKTRVVRTVIPNYRQDRDEFKKTLDMSIGSRKLGAKNAYLEWKRDSGDVSKILEFFQKKGVREKDFEYFQDYVILSESKELIDKDFLSDILDIKYAGSTEAQGKLIKHYFEGMDEEDIKNMVISMKVAGVNITDNMIKEVILAQD